MPVFEVVRKPKYYSAMIWDGKNETLDRICAEVLKYNISLRYDKKLEIDTLLNEFVTLVPIGGVILRNWETGDIEFISGEELSHNFVRPKEENVSENVVENVGENTVTCEQ